MLYPWLVRRVCVSLLMGCPLWVQMAVMPFVVLVVFVVVKVMVVFVRLGVVVLFSPMRAPLYGIMLVVPFGVAFR